MFSPGLRPVIVSSLAVSGLQELPAECCKCCTDKGCDDEDPDLLDRERLSGDGQEHCGAEAPCGVDRGTGKADAHEVDEGQCETDDDSALCSGRLGGGDSECCEDEDEGQQNLDDDGTEYLEGDGVVIFAVSVASETGCFDEILDPSGSRGLFRMLPHTVRQ